MHPVGLAEDSVRTAARRLTGRRARRPLARRNILTNPRFAGLSFAKAAVPDQHSYALSSTINPFIEGTHPSRRVPTFLSTDAGHQPRASGPSSARRRGRTRMFITGPVTSHAARTRPPRPPEGSRTQRHRARGSQPTNSPARARQISATIAPTRIHMTLSITVGYRITVRLCNRLRRSTGSVSESNLYTLIVPTAALCGQRDVICRIVGAGAASLR